MASAKQIKFDLINPDDNSQPSKLLEEVRKKWHQETADARVVLAWKLDTKPDQDDRIVLGRCVPVGDLQKELIDYDFIITLNKEVWEDQKFDADKKRALLDHEMSHIAPVYDGEGKNKVDSRNRRVWRTRGHDIEEFSAVVERHGTYKHDLERFAEALLKVRGTPLFSGIEQAPATETVQ